MNTASDWINTDRASVVKDIERLGVDGAAEYQMDLIEQATERGDGRWNGITLEDMVEALVELE